MITRGPFKTAPFPFWAFKTATIPSISTDESTSQSKPTTDYTTTTQINMVLQRNGFANLKATTLSIITTSHPLSIITTSHPLSIITTSQSSKILIGLMKKLSNVNVQIKSNACHKK